MHQEEEKTTAKGRPVRPLFVCGDMPDSQLDVRGEGEVEGVNAQIDLLQEKIVDSFAGGGGASVGIELATGRVVDIAINHDPDAILMHKTNHPHTTHYQASVWDVDPVQVCAGSPVGLLWASPDCKHFSKAKGGKPVDKRIRGLAWIVLRWAGTVRPRVVMLENVEEFQTWGPVRRGRPVKSKTGQTFRRFVGQLKDLGYVVEWRELVAADYGAPTTRKRFFLVARCDGRPIAWPEPTHAPADSPEVERGEKLPWRSAAEIIDWTLPCPSIFDTRERVREKYGLNAQRPLRPNTMRRVARGVDKFVIKAASPFLVPMGYGERDGQAPRVHDIFSPVPTSVGKGKHGICQPFMVQLNHAGEFRGQTVESQIRTITAKHGYGIAEPAMIPWTVTNTTNSTGHPVNEPVDTARTGGGGGQMFLGASMIQYHTEHFEHVRGQEISGPIITIDAANRYGLTAASLVKYYGNDQHGQNIRDPLHTVTAKDREGLTMAHMAKFYGTEFGESMWRPLSTVTASGAHHGVVTTRITKAEPGADLGHWTEIRELLNTYCGYRLGPEDVLLFNIGGIAYFMADIGLRMLTPRELYRANGFPDDYIIDRDYKGNAYGKSKQVARCGNAVPPPFATALVRANLPEWCGRTITTMAGLEKEVAV